MSIELSEEQRHAVRNGEPVRLQNPEIGGEIVVLWAEEYDHLRELLEDEQQRKAFRDAGLRTARRWLRENPY